MMPVTTDRLTPLDMSRRWVNVTGTHGPFVQFSFIVADPDLSVELVLPYLAFSEFCEANGVELSVDPTAATCFERLKWRSRQASGERTALTAEATRNEEVK